MYRTFVTADSVKHEKALVACDAIIPTRLFGVVWKHCKSSSSQLTNLTNLLVNLFETEDHIQIA